MDPPHIKSSCGTRDSTSNPMGIRLGFEYVTGRNMQKWMPPTSNRHLGPRKKFQPYVGIGLGIDYVSWRNLQKRNPPHQIFIPEQQEYQMLWVYGWELPMSTSDKK